jgi:hypothetical protein
VQFAAGTAAGKGIARAVGVATRKRGKYKKREQELIRELAEERWPGGAWEHVRTPLIIETLDKEFKDRGLPVPERDQYLRALGRRKD